MDQNAAATVAGTRADRAGVGVVAAAPQLLRGDLGDPVWLGVVGPIAGLVTVGVLVAAFTEASHRITTNAFAGLGPAQRTMAIRASWRGPVPDDAGVRAAATWVAQRRLGSARAWRVIWLVLLGFSLLGLASSMARGERTNSGWIIGAAELLVVTLAIWYVPVGTKRRLQRLEQHNDPPTS